MNGKPGRRGLFRLPLSERTVEGEVADEVSFHIESRIEELVRAGHSAGEARARAMKEFGDLAAARAELAHIDRERVRRRRITDVFDGFRQDLRLVLRSMRREPWFAAAVIGTLGLGIGVNAAMFGITDRLLFRAPPGVNAPDQVKRIFSSRTTSRGLTHERAVNYPDYDALRKVSGFEELAAYFNTDAAMGRGAEATKIRWSIASANLFTALRVKPLIGRFYTAAEDQPGSNADVVVLGHAFWKKRFGGERDVIGREVVVGKKKYTVIGIAPPGFNGVEYEAVDMYAPLSIAGPQLLGEDWNTPNVSWIRLVGRLSSAATAAQVSAEATAIHLGNNKDLQQDRTARVTAESVILAKAPRESTNKVFETAQIALWLSGLSLLVLVIACANVINLLLVRVHRRQREVGIRMALGVGRARLVSYFVLETLVLAVAGGLAGLAIAQWGGGIIRRLLLPDMDWSTGAIDKRVLAYSAVLVGLCTLLAAAAPALQSLRTNLSAILKSGAREGAHRSALRDALVALQATISVVLLVVAGLFVRSQLNLQHMDKGFDPEHVMAMYWDTDVIDVAGADAENLYREAAERVKRLPGVEGAAVAMTVPFWSSMSARIKVPGVDSIPETSDGGPYYNAVQPDFFNTMNTRIVRGRAFTSADRANAPKVVIVSETMARLIWHREDPLGKCVYLNGDEKECRTVVGVAQNALRNALEADVMMLYTPLDQQRPSSFRTLFIRTRGDPVLLQPQIRAAFQSMRKDMPYADIRVMSDLMSPQMRQWQLGAALFSAFGLLALFLAGLGLYSVIAYNVSQRTRELSVRMALGARAKHLIELVVGDAARVVIIGLVLGMIGAMYASTRTAPLLFHVAPWDGPVFSGVVVVLLGVGVVAALIPALRALRIAPNHALKEE